MSVLILNGSPSGKNGNCAQLIGEISKELQRRPHFAKMKTDVIHLADQKWTAGELKKMKIKFAAAKGFFFVSGTYWDSWGSPLQLFLENITDLEGQSELVGKPAVICVLNHSVGGKAVLSRLQGVLSTFGFLIPPMSGLVFSWINQEVMKNKKSSEAFKDLWSLKDIAPIVDNFELAIQLKVKWKTWPVDRKDYRKIWIET